jgi:hypothetical protein
MALTILSFRGTKFIVEAALEEMMSTTSMMISAERYTFKPLNLHMLSS